jgi:hypothetical protein
MDCHSMELNFISSDTDSFTFDNKSQESQKAISRGTGNTFIWCEKLFLQFLPSHMYTSSCLLHFFIHTEV